MIKQLKLRLPAKLHSQLVRIAKKDGLSLNSYIVRSLERKDQWEVAYRQMLSDIECRSTLKIVNEAIDRFIDHGLISHGPNSITNVVAHNIDFMESRINEP